MSAPKYFQCLTGKYSFLSSHMRLSRNLSRTYSMKLGLKHRLPSNFISAEPSMEILSTIHLHNISHPYSSQASSAEQPQESPTFRSNLQPVTFEDMSFEQPVPHEELLAALHKCKTLTEQMETLASTLALSPEDIDKRRKFCRTLESLFEPFFNNFRIQMFGSTVNYFGFKGCDIDMTFETSTEPKDKGFYLERPDVPLVCEVLSGKVSSQEISELPHKEQLLFMHTVMLEYYKESKEPAIFINAHVPLVRFHHDKFNLKCDLTFKNRVAFANTKLLYFFAKQDKRVVPLIMTLRYWAKHVELIGKGLMFNTYTITLLVVYFLQTRTPPIIPSAKYILSLSKSFEIEDMDDKSFLNLIESIPPSNNTQTLDELLREFFFFYLHFDFTRVICPLTGTSVPREEFFSDEKNRKFRNNTICVQDPLCTSHNVAELVDFKHCRKLYSELITMCRIFQENKLLTPSSDAWGLMTMLDKPKKHLFQSTVACRVFSFTLPLLHRAMQDGISLKEQASSSAKVLLEILQHVLLFECSHIAVDKIKNLLERQDKLIAEDKKRMETKIYNRHNSSSIRKGKSNANIMYETEVENFSKETLLEQFQKDNADNLLILSSLCKVSKNTWLGREFIKLNTTNLSVDLLNREHLISVEAAKLNEQTFTQRKTKQCSFLLECYISSSAPETSMLVNFRPLQKGDFNEILGIFLKEYIPKIMSNLNDSK